MPPCFWTLCTCPTAQPCVEHSGFHCSRWTTLFVANESQVSDATTRNAELALVRLAAERTKLREMRTQLERRKSELEQEQREIEDALRTADTFDERRQAAAKVRQAYRTVRTVQAEMQQAMADLSVLNGRVNNVGGLVSLSILVPYTSPTGYCACYQEKLRRLGVLAAAAGRHRRQLAPLHRQFGFINNQIFGFFSQGPGRNLLKNWITLSFLAMLAAWVAFGAAAMVPFAIIGLMGVAIILASLLISAVLVLQQMAAVRARIVRLDLSYYRQQSIATCQQPPAGAALAPGTAPAFVDDNAALIGSSGGSTDSEDD